MASGTWSNSRQSHAFVAPCLAAESRKEVPASPLEYEAVTSVSGMPTTVASCIAAKPATAPFMSKQVSSAVHV